MKLAVSNVERSVFDHLSSAFYQPLLSLLALSGIFFLFMSLSLFLSLSFFLSLHLPITTHHKEEDEKK